MRNQEAAAAQNFAEEGWDTLDGNPDSHSSFTPPWDCSDSQVSHIKHGTKRCLQFNEPRKLSVEDPASDNPSYSQVGDRSSSDLASTKATTVNPANVKAASSISGNSLPLVPRKTGMLHLNSIVSAGALSSEVENMNPFESLAKEKNSSFITGNKFPAEVNAMSVPCEVDDSIKEMPDKDREALFSGIMLHRTLGKPSNDNLMREPYQALLGDDEKQGLGLSETSEESNQVNTLMIEPYQAPVGDDEKQDLELSETLVESNHVNHGMKRKKASSSADDGVHKGCTCTKSKCLKLYCDCFAEGYSCSASCACHGCRNKKGEEIAIEARQQIQSRDPLAFAPKIITPPGYGASSRHKRGCNCGKSKCLKKYCECYKAHVGCSDACRCVGCGNSYGRKGDYGPILGVKNKLVNAEISEGRSNEMLQMTAARDGISFCLTQPTPSFQCTNLQNIAPESLITSGIHILQSGLDFPSLLSRKNYPSVQGSCITFPSITAARSLETRNLMRNIPITQMPPSVNDHLTNSKTCFTAPSGYKLPISAPAPCSSKEREFRNIVSGTPVPFVVNDPLTGRYLHWQGGPDTPDIQQLRSTNFQYGSRSQQYNLPYEMLNDHSTPIQEPTIPFPRVVRDGQLGSNSLGALASGTRFIRQAASPCPPMTPTIFAQNITSLSRRDVMILQTPGYQAHNAITERDST